MTQPNSDSSGKWFLFAIIGVFIVGGLGVAVAISRGGADDPDNFPASAAVQIDGDPLPALAQGGGITSGQPDDAVGMTAATLTGEDFLGETVTIEADGRPKAVYFIAHWCPHCQDEVPLVQGLINAGQVPEGIDIYSVSTAIRPASGNFPPYSWLEDEGWTPPVMLDTEVSDALVAYGAGGFPYVVYLDGDNKVLFRTTGSLDAATTTELWNQVAASVG